MQRKLSRNAGSRSCQEQVRNQGSGVKCCAEARMWVQHQLRRFHHDNWKWAWPSCIPNALNSSYSMQELNCDQIWYKSAARCGIGTQAHIGKFYPMWCPNTINSKSNTLMMCATPSALSQAAHPVRSQGRRSDGKGSERIPLEIALARIPLAVARLPGPCECPTRWCSPEPPLEQSTCRSEVWENPCQRPWETESLWSSWNNCVGFIWCCTKINIWHPLHQGAVTCQQVSPMACVC